MRAGQCDLSGKLRTVSENGLSVNEVSLKRVNSSGSDGCTLTSFGLPESTVIVAFTEDWSSSIFSVVFTSNGSRFTILTVAVFCVEYALRLWTSEFLYPTRSKAEAALRFMFSFDGIDIENIFIDCRLHEEAEHAHETKYDGLRWKKVGQSLHCDDEFSYDCITVEVEMFTPGDWDFLQADWEAHDGYKDDSAGAAQHQRLREARAIRFTSVFWFNISNFFF